MRKTDDSLAIWFIISAVLHIAVLAVVFHAKEKPVFMSAPIDVSFYAPSENVVTPPPADVAEEPKPEPAQEEIKEPPVTKEDVVVKKKDKPKPKPKPKVKAKEPEPPAVKEQAQEAKVQTVQTPADADIRYAAAGAQYEGLAFDTENFKYAYYTNTIIRKIGRFWQWSESYGRLRAVVYFRILRDGTVASIQIKDSSGDESFDQNAERSVQLASPFAPLPDGYRGESLGVYFEFKFRT
ncbi:MAG: energy transducer TonB [Endomicrobium sp.]|jgi:protein TonB|nr:energy transducer TonB [Endomicrobium sp.]